MATVKKVKVKMATKTKKRKWMTALPKSFKFICGSIQTCNYE
jgi:hypothetical protein